MSVYFSLIFQQLIAGGTHIVAKATLHDVDPVTLTLLRSIITACIMVIVMLLKEPRWRIERVDYVRLFWLSLFAVPINQFVFFYGISRSTASNAALLYATTPVVVLILSRVILKEPATWKKIIGVAVALVGVAFVIFEDGLQLNSSHTHGNLLLVVAVFAWALTTVYGKPMIRKYGAFYVTSLVLVLGMILYLPLGILYGNLGSVSSLTAPDWGGVLYLCIGTSVLGYFLWYYALERVDASKVAIFSNAQPFFTTILAVILLGQGVSTTFVIGGLLTISGVILVQLG
ncbi:MAG: EamA family transporter [Bacteroidota bacterium]